MWAKEPGHCHPLPEPLHVGGGKPSGLQVRGILPSGPQELAEPVSLQGPGQGVCPHAQKALCHLSLWQVSVLFRPPEDGHRPSTVYPRCLVVCAGQGQHGQGCVTASTSPPFGLTGELCAEDVVLLSQKETKEETGREKRTVKERNREGRERKRIHPR